MAGTSVSRRIKESIFAFQRQDFESSLIHFFPALDKTAKKRRPREGVGKRIKSFISDQEGLISIIATGILIRDVNDDGVDFPYVIYKFGRCSILHEGELDRRLKINQTGEIAYGGDTWNLPSTYIMGLIISVVIAPENENERIDGDFRLTLLEKDFFLNKIWGKEDEIKLFYSKTLNKPSLFT